MRGLVRIAVAFACLVLAPAAARAQATITGTVKDTSGAVLPGVTVEAASPALIEKSKTTITDAAGLYRIVDLRPGTYTVTVSLPGFATIKRDGIEVTGSATLTLPFELTVGAVQETVTVTGASPVVDVQNTRRETVINASSIESLPATRAYGSILNAMPGVTVDNNGLAATPTMTFFSAHGGRTNEGRMSINGMTVAAAFNGGGVSSLTYDTSNAEEVVMVVSGGLGENETGGPTMNIVQKSGGNKFSGQAFFNTAGDWSRGDNIDDTLRSQGITRGPGIKSAYDASGSIGGPIKQDRLWFFGTYRSYSTTSGVSGIGANRFEGDASHWDYARDDSVEPRLVQGRKIWAARGTAQVTPKNRVMFSQENQYRCEGSTLTPSGSGCRTRGADWIALGSTTQSPESNTGYFDFPYWVTQATWTATATNKLLLEAGYSRFAYRHAGGPGQVPPDGILDLIPVTEQAAIDGHPANFTYRGLATYLNNFGNPNNWRASASYMYGAHNMKLGYQGAYLIADSEFDTNQSQLLYRFNNHVPNQFTYRLPQFQTADRTKMTALFFQDNWTRDRLTLQGALRYDQVSSFSPAEHNGTSVTSPFNPQPVILQRTDGVSAYRDISPRVGVAYDVFGNGKTAVKFNYGRYLGPATNDTIYTQNNPANGIVGYNLTAINRGWTDVNGNYKVDCDILNPNAQTVPGGDICGALTGNSLNFGKTGTSTRVNPALLHGWNIRPSDSQWGINLQQELMPRVSLDLGYNRRSWNHFTVTDNTAVGPNDYQPWTITAPTDPRLPGGGGYPITMYTLTAAAAARPADNYVTFETDFGPARINYWHGVDVTVTARLNRGTTLQIGTTTGRAINDTCATILNVDSPDPRFCREVDPVETTLRGLASYMIPKIDVQISATFRSQPPVIFSAQNPTIFIGIQPTTPANAPTSANWNVPNTVVQSLLGRLPPGGLANGNTLVPLLDNTLRAYGASRRNQLDMRFAKVLRFSGRRLDVGMDLQNILNANYGPLSTSYESQYDYTAPNGGTWLNPTTILGPRFARLNVTFNF
ncbi:MAG TPA: TonB-dependent receptor [Vicinamibacterales bacterium]|nr:TonB-dependent receptor [Vicinamibacterales bacterium]